MVSVPRLAKSIVGDSLRPKEFEPVVISTYPHTIELAEAIALECQKHGADPITVLDTDRLFYDQFKNYPEENLRRTSAHCLGLLEYAKSYVWLGGPRDPAPMARVPEEKWSAMFAGEQAHNDKDLEKKPKSVGVAIGQVTRERAKTYRFNYPAWKASVESAITANYARLEAAGQHLAVQLSVPAEVRITAENGTDLRFRLAGLTRKVQVNDGVISDEDVAAGNVHASLPAGEVWVAPVEASAEGTFVCDLGVPQVGRIIEGLTWTFEHGKVTDFTATRNLAASQVNWEGAGGQKDMFGGFGIGINPRAKAGFLTNSIVSGAVTAAIGDNRDLGGTNRSDYGFSGTLAKGTVEIDDKTVIDRGRRVA